MDGMRSTKQENPFEVIRIRRTPDEIMEQELAAGIYRLHVPDGYARPRRFYKAVSSELFPLRLVSRLTDDAVACGCDEVEFLNAVVGPITRMVRAKFKTQRVKVRLARRGDTEPPTPAQMMAA